MPSRARTSSEGGVYGSRHLVPHRPQSLYSHSPPHAGSPASPASAACSTDSAGSSLSIDEPDNWLISGDYTFSSDISHQQQSLRYSHSLTPDEPIVEENCDEGTENPYASTSPETGQSPANTGAYVPMAPLSSDDGYVDMSPRGRHSMSHDMSPAASSCSITSGTPSTDMRFSEYHLEKVSSYFTPSEEDDTSSAERPIRAYSVGSRPDTFSGNRHDNARVRAFSVGSRSKGCHIQRILPPSHTPHTPSNNGAKSSSAPLLNRTGSHSSVERMDDFVEIDFSKLNPHPGYVDMSPRTNRGYVEMKPGVVDNNKLRFEVSFDSPSKRPETEQPYLDMRPASSPLQCPGRDNPYMDMQPSTSPTCPLRQITAKPKYKPYEHESSNYYMDMTPGAAKMSSYTPPKPASPIQEEYMDMEFHPPSTSGKSPDGYLEMSYNRKSSLDSSITHRDEYVNMTATRTRKERKGSKKEKTTRSQPIAITQPSTTVTTTTGIPTSRSPSSSFYSYTQKTVSPKQPPPSYLPLSTGSCSPSGSPFSSLRRPRSRKSSRRDSKDSVTPTSDQSTIFPFSPGSPVKPFQQNSPQESSRKCAVDASSGTVRLAKNSSDYMEMTGPLNQNIVGVSSILPNIPKTSENQSTDYVNFCPKTSIVSTTTESMVASDDYGEYAVMRPVVTTSQQRFIVNSAPFSGTLTKQLSGLSVTPCVFKPITEPERIQATSPRPGDVAPHRSFENLRSGAGADSGYETLSPVAKVSRPSSVVGSRPGSVSSDRSRPSSVSSELGKSGTLSRPSSVSSELGSTSSTIVGSRPESVCAEATRPPSVSSERELHYASLDLATIDDDGTRSPRQSKDTRSPTPSTSTEPCFTYAEIDFGRSEVLKQGSLSFKQ